MTVRMDRIPRGKSRRCSPAKRSVPSGDAKSNFLSALLMAALLCLAGCGQPPQPTQKGEKQFEPVIGAFGLKLGEQAPATNNLVTNEDGRIWFDFNLDDDQKPFFRASAEVTPAGQIYEIVGETIEMDKHSDGAEFQRTLLLKLRDKYGDRFPGARNYSAEKVSESFGGGDNMVFVMGNRERLSVTYTLGPLYDEEDKRLKAIKSARMKKTLNGL